MFSSFSFSFKEKSPLNIKNIHESDKGTAKKSSGSDFKRKILRAMKAKAFYESLKTVIRVELKNEKKS